MSRTTIAAHVAPAFTDGGASLSELLAVATGTNAPPPVLERLAELPEQRYAHLRDLWRLMPEVPVE